MALQPSKAMKPIHNLYIDVTLPGPGNDLQLVNGVPTTGTHLGLCGPSTVTPGIETAELDCDNQLAPVLEAITKDTTEISISLYEISAAWLRIAQNASGAGRKVIFGGKSSIATHSLAIVYEPMAGAGVYGYYLIYKAQLTGPSAHALSKAEYSQIEITFSAKAHESYTSGALYEHMLPTGFE
jgi:hypothetical protein